MQTIPVAHFGRYAIVTRQTDDPEWQIYHPTDDDFGKFWFVDPVDAYQHLAYIEERELSDWEASEGVDDDGYPLVQTLYKVWTFSSDSVTEHDVAHLASVTLPNVQELIGWALNALDAGDTEKAKALLRQAL